MTSEPEPFHKPDQPAGKKFGTVMLLLAWVVGLGLAWSWFSSYLERDYNPNSAPVTVVRDGSPEIALQRNRYGAYVLGGAINGYPVTFLVDTGATQVAVPAQLARDLGLRRGLAVTVSTANGEVQAWRSSIKRVSIGDLVIHDVDALINPGMNGDEVLLGMSALAHLEFRQFGDELVLRARNL